MKTKKIRMTVCALVLVFSVMVGTVQAYADDEQDAGRAVASVYDTVKVFVLPLAALGIAGSGIQILMGDENDAAKAKKRIVIILCAAVAIWFLPTVAVWGRKLLGGTAWSPENPTG